MKRSLFSKIIILWSWLILISGWSSGKAISAISEYDDLQILKSDQDGVIFNYLVPKLNKSQIQLGGQFFDIINIDRCALANLPGKPQLPIRKVVIGVPLDAEISVEISDKVSSEQAGINLAYAQKIEVDEKSPLGYSLSPLKTKVISDQLAPSDVVSFSPAIYLRNQRIIELEISPVQFNPARKSIRYYSQITVKVSFIGVKKESFAKGKDLFEKIYRNVLLNYEQSKGWRKTSEQSGLLKPGLVYPFDYSDNWYKVVVTENGINKIDRSMLIQAGISISSLDPRTLRMFSGGGRELPLSNSNPFLELKELSIYVAGEEDGKFDTDDFILFYGWSTNDWDYDSTGKVKGFHTNPFTNDNVFWLTFNPTSPFPNPQPKRMQIKDGSLAEPSPITPLKFESKVHSEQDNTLREYSNGYVDNYFHWYWIETTSIRTFVSLPGASSQDTAWIKVSHTESNPSILVNGVPALILDPLSSASLTVAISFSFHGGLVDTLDISFPSATYLDWYEIEYSRRFECYDRQLFFESPEISGATQFNISNLFSSQTYLFDVTDYFDVKKFEPVPIEGEFARFQDTIIADVKTRYFLVDESRIKTPVRLFQDEKSNWRKASNRADFLIITHSDFYDQIQSLKSFRESYNRMSVAVVKAQDIYDEFSGGLFDPVAIRDFLKFAYQNWEEPPAFTLLVGDGNYDYKNHLGYGAVNFIPPFAPTWEGDRSVSDENYVYFGRYGYLDTDSSYGHLDRGVDMVISRWPVRTNGEVEIVLDKVVNYEKTPEFGNWRNLITLVADDEFTDESNSEAIHTQDTEELAKLHIPSSFDLFKIYLMEYPFDFKREKPEAEDAIVAAFNSGALIINYMGHGNPDVWSHEHVFKRAQDIPRLSNKRKLPLVYTSSCSIGFFFSPTSEGMAEEFLRAEDKGAIATISATWLVYPDPNAELNFKVYDLLLSQDSLSIGEALFIAKLLRKPNSNDRQYVLFGDPVMKLGAPQLKVELTEVTPETLSALSLIRVKGEVKKDDQSGVMTDFNGSAKILAFDSQRKRIHTMPGGGKVSYGLPGLIMFKGDTEVKEGKFQASFMVPKDISYGGNTGRISVYVWGQNSIGSIDQDGVGVQDSLVIRGSDTTVIDTIGPQIALSFDDRTTFSDGETILPSSILKLSLGDEHGINMTGEVGHGITLVIDQDLEHQIDVTGDFEYEPGSYQKGEVSYQFSNLSGGDHNLTIKAWDNANNSSLISVNVKVSAQKELELTQVMNYPNPFSNVTNFYYHLSSDAEMVEIKIFTLSGRLIRDIPYASSRTGINFSATWDGKDQEGDEVANGVYIYKILAKGLVNGKQEKSEVFGKAVVVR